MKISIPAILFCLGLLILPAVSESGEFHQEGWPIPDLRALIPYSVAINRVDGAEKIVEKFYTLDGGHVARISGNGKVFAYAVDRDTEPPIDYLLLDLDGSGRFTMKLKPHETYVIPDWIFR